MFAHLVGHSGEPNLAAAFLRKAVARYPNDHWLNVALVDFLRARKEADEPGLAEILEFYEAAGEPLNSLEDAYDRVLFRSLAREAYESHPKLN